MDPEIKKKKTMFYKILTRHRIVVLFQDHVGPMLDESLVGISSFPKFFRLLNCEHFFQRSPQVQTKHWNKYACVLHSICWGIWHKTKTWAQKRDTSNCPFLPRMLASVLFQESECPDPWQEQPSSPGLSFPSTSALDVSRLWISLVKWL